MNVNDRLMDFAGAMLENGCDKFRNACSRVSEGLDQGQDLEQLAAALEAENAELQERWHETLESLRTIGARIAANAETLAVIHDVAAVAATVSETEDPAAAGSDEIGLDFNLFQELTAKL